MKAEYVKTVNDMCDEREALATRGWENRKVTRTQTVKNMCQPFSEMMVDRHPELRLEKGFIGSRGPWSEDDPGTEHWWCVAPDGEIVDPTIQQFTADIHGSPKFFYTPYDPEKHTIYLGACANCGSGCHGKEGTYTGFCDEECAEDYARYIAREAGAG